VRRFEEIRTERLLMRRCGLREHGFLDHPVSPDGHRVRPHVVYHAPLPISGLKRDL